jgi:hypothetical protein
MITTRWNIKVSRAVVGQTLAKGYDTFNPVSAVVGSDFCLGAV